MAVKYVIGHWTAGASRFPTEYEKKHYQLLIDANKGVHFGAKPGKTESTGGMNSITYNIACCGGLDETPMTIRQIEEFCYQAAKSLKIYGLKPEHFYTHAEIGEMTRNYLNKQKGRKVKNPDCNGRLITELLPYNIYLDQNVGKIDLRKLPTSLFQTGTGTYSAQTSGGYLRSKIRWYFENKF